MTTCRNTIETPAAHHGTVEQNVCLAKLYLVQEAQILLRQILLPNTYQVSDRAMYQVSDGAIFKIEYLHPYTWYYAKGSFRFQYCKLTCRFNADLWVPLPALLTDMTNPRRCIKIRKFIRAWLQSMCHAYPPVHMDFQDGSMEPFGRWSHFVSHWMVRMAIHISGGTIRTSANRRVEATFSQLLKYVWGHCDHMASIYYITNLLSNHVPNDADEYSLLGHHPVIAEVANAPGAVFELEVLN
jgi:hypothetical protein